MQGVRIFPGQSLLLKQLRLVALADSPAAFGSSYEAEASFSDDDWYSFTRAAAWFTVVSDNGEEIGLIAGRAGPIFEVISMWVHPDHRRAGVGRLLLKTMATWAELEEANEIGLKVMDGNQSAISFYEKCGFTTMGTSDDPVCGAVTEMVTSLPLSF